MCVTLSPSKCVRWVQFHGNSYLYDKQTDILDVSFNIGIKIKYGFTKIKCYLIAFNLFNPTINLFIQNLNNNLPILAKPKLTA